MKATKIILHRMGRDYRIKGKPFPRHPVLIGAKGIVLPVSDYLEELAAQRNKAAGSVLGTAGILLEWFRALSAKRLDWSQASDEFLREWATAQEGTISIRRIATKIGTVFDFYRVVQSKFKWIDRVVGENSSKPGAWRYPLSYEIVIRKHKDGRETERLKPSYSYATIPQSPRRPTPTAQQVEVLGDALLDKPNLERATMWWLAASWMHAVGLRIGGVVSLTLGSISSALAAEGIMDSTGRAWNLSLTASDACAQDQIKLAIARLREDRRQEIGVAVTEKGKKTRTVPVPLDLLENVLDYIWGARAHLIKKLASSRPRYRASEALFISLKTGAAFASKSLGNEFKRYFSKLGIPGSGHRLRARFAMAHLLKGYLKARAAHGRAYDVRSILHDTAEVMGHSHTNTLKPYLGDVIKEENALPGEPILVLSSDHAALLRGLSEALELTGAPLSAALQRFCDLHGIEARPEIVSVHDLRRAIERRERSLTTT